MNEGPAYGFLVRVGRPVRVVVMASDPDGDALTYGIRNPPRGTTFDEANGALAWTPTPDELGKHELVFEVSDGKSRITQTVTLFVQPNRAPSADNAHPLLYVARATAGDGDGVRTIARDPDSDDISFTAQKLPPGARLHSYGDSAGITWPPGPDAEGEHELVVVVSDGELESSIERKLVVFPAWSEDDYKAWFLPGGGASGFLTHDDGTLFLGGAFDVTLAALREDGRAGYQCASEERHNGCRASHHRFYAEFELLDALRSGEPSLFTYGAGYSASFEYYPARRFLIPHYGIELGGLVRDELGHRAQTRPYLGVHLWADRKIWLNATLGYRVVPAELYELSGPTFTLRAVLNPW